MQGNSLTQFRYEHLLFPMITVYDHPSDFPHHYVARIWEGSVPVATQDYVLYESLDKCRMDITAAGFSLPLPRSAEDDICIVESYIR